MAFLTYLLIIRTKIVVEALEHLYQYFSAFVHCQFISFVPPLNLSQ